MVIKTKEFTPERKRQSCVVQNTYENRYFVFMKGSPEVVVELCKKNSVPENFNEILDFYSQKGKRILAFASKELQKEQLDLSIKEIESQMKFEGFLILKNKLKKQTTGVLNNLKSVGVKNIMITGDNLNTAISVAKKCGIFHAKQQVQILQLNDFQKIMQKVDFQTIQNQTIQEKTVRFDLIEKTTNLFSKQNLEFALSGDFFEFLYPQIKNSFSLLKLILEKTFVYGRTNPQQKALIVEAYKIYQKNIIKKNFLVGFCGDGANDCPALKTAHIGLSLSQQEASIAAPFTSSSQNILSVQKLLIEGKACMQTGITNFEYICCSSLFTFFNLIIIYYLNLNYTNGQYYTYDLFLYTPLSIIMCSSKTSGTLTKKYPSSSLLNKSFLVRNVFTLIIVFIGFCLVCLTISAFETYLPARMTGIYLGNEFPSESNGTKI